MNCLRAILRIVEYAWVVSKNDEVAAVLNHPHLHVRPPDEPVPALMHGTALGEIYGRLVRMNEGKRHDALRRRALGIVAGWDLQRVSKIARQVASVMPVKDIGAYVVAVMIGLSRPAEALPYIRDFAAAIAGGASEDAILRGIAATPHLLESLPPHDGLDEQANRLGFLFQAYAATATLIEHALDGAAVPPVVMTRRWASRDIELFGLQVKRGDAFAVLLTAPQFNFGAGRHACPGQAIAHAIADTVALASGASR